MGYLDKTVLRNVIQVVKTAIFIMVCVILDVIRAGRETFVTKLAIKGHMVLIAKKRVAIVGTLTFVYILTEHV